MADLSFYKGKKVLITGHTGFKGSWLCRILVGAGAEVTGYSLSAPTEPNLFALCDVEGHMNSVIGDIRDLDHLANGVCGYHSRRLYFISQHSRLSAILTRIRVYTYETNVMGTVNICECVRRNSCVKSFLNVTTDKVYQE